ncbi:BadF/BadG/BcrA/BcrD ATPase family protein [Sulfobacillus thermosulfidooxidans]|uniref:BadF/BadG/BcrA/BcrD ATPase family protein n=1 Tax=Sulfobacillus thermosulfidooxidans TaxID=28034 RepID=UPI0006B61D2B|nr:BadF/BadG/BcrA/BcrD ATPase family protein [Sulfobacillus thermosulfidooxidans]
MYIGVDGGGTSTRGIIEIEDGRFGELATSSASNLLMVGPDLAYAAMDEVIDRLSQQADISVVEGVIGVAGADRLEVLSSWQRYFARRGIKRLWITGDYWLPWANFTKGADGVIGILGTGSIFFGRHGAKTLRLGGYGWKLGDVGSGLSLGQQAIRKAMESWEGIQPRTLLVPKCLEFFAVSSMQDVLDQLYRPSFPLRHLADFASEVFSAAMMGDLLADQLLKAEAEKIMRNFDTLITALPIDAPIVGVSGGLARFWQPYLARLIQKENPLMSLLVIDEPAVYGAVWLAKKWSQERRPYDVPES